MTTFGKWFADIVVLNIEVYMFILIYLMPFQSCFFAAFLFNS